MQIVNGGRLFCAAFHPGWEFGLSADARQARAVTTGRAPMSSLEPTPVANSRRALPPVAMNGPIAPTQHTGRK